MQEVCNKCEGTGAGLMLECSKCDGIGYVYGDAVLSDLEIVHKALSIDESCRLTILPIGAWCFYDSRSDEVYADGNDFESLLAWAKQTIEGVE